MNVLAYVQGLYEKIVKDPMPPKRVASGWALGMFIGCTVPFGLQLLVSVPLSFYLRVSKIGATVGTLITNPVTIFFIYPAQTWVGGRLLGFPFTWSYVKEVCVKLSHISLFCQEGWQLLAEISGQVLAGFFFGGFVFAFVCTPITYFMVLRLVALRRRTFAAEGFITQREKRNEN